MQNTLWKVVAGIAAAGAALAARNAAETVWRQTRHQDPPVNPASPTTSWGEAIAWTAVVGMLAALARLLAHRGAAAAWQKAAGTLPPGLEEAS
jgi:hypothetical protein